MDARFLLKALNELRINIIPPVEDVQFGCLIAGAAGIQKNGTKDHHQDDQKRNSFFHASFPFFSLTFLFWISSSRSLRRLRILTISSSVTTGMNMIVEIAGFTPLALPTAE